MQKWHPPVLLAPARVSPDPRTSGRRFKISEWISFTEGLGTVQSVVFVLGPRVNEVTVMHGPFIISISIFYSPLNIPSLCPIAFKASLGACLFGLGLTRGSIRCGVSHLYSWGRCSVWRSPIPTVGPCTRSGVWGETRSLPRLSFYRALFILLWWDSSARSQSFLK